MSYTQIFGGNTIYPSDVSLLDIDLTADIALEWPLESAASDYPAARIIDVTATGGYAISLPDATLTGAGQTLLFNNLSASASPFNVKDFSGNVLATIGIGAQWQLYLSGTATPAGTWRVFRFGASTATVQPASLAGYGITTTSNTLSQSMPVTTFSLTPRTLLSTDRASVLVWEGTGAGTLNLPAAPGAGNNFFVSVRNSGGGALTVDPDGTEVIDGASTLVLQPGDSTTITTDGLEWYTVGLGQQAVFAFDFTAIIVTGGTYTLSGSELNRIAYRFTGVLTSDATIIVPPTVQQYWIDNATTGAHTLTIKTASGTGSVVTQGARGIYYCDGVNFVDADTSTVPLPISVANGGTGQTSYATGDLLYAASPTSMARLSDVAVGNALLSGGVGVAPAWGKIDLATHVSGSLPTANGGTGAGSFTANGVLYGNGSGSLGVTAAGSSGQVLVGNTGTAPSWSTLSSVSVTTLSGGTTGLTPSGATSGAITLGGSLVVAHGGTGQTSLTAGHILKGNGTSAVSASVIYDDGTNIGIGTTSPGSLLHLNRSAGAVDVRYSVAGVLYGTQYASASDMTLGTIPALPLIFVTNNTERFRISSTGAITSSPLADAVGYKGLPQNAQTSGYTLALSDIGKHVSITTGGITIPANASIAFPIGASAAIYNDSGSTQTIGITSDTLRWAGTTSTGTRTLSAYGIAAITKVGATTWVVSGNVY